jgi:hypothetical protein
LGSEATHLWLEIGIGIGCTLRSYEQVERVKHVSCVHRIMVRHLRFRQVLLLDPMQKIYYFGFWDLGNSCYVILPKNGRPYKK